MPVLTPLAIYNELYRQYGPQRWWPARSDFEMVLGAILTQNTAWTNVEKAIGRLRARRLLSISRFSKASPKLIAETIRPSGTFRVKTERLKSFTALLMSHYGGSLKDLLSLNTQELRKKLLAVKGIGPETADSIILYAARKPIFVVDAYTRRIFQRIGLFGEGLSYDSIQHFFSKRLPVNTRLFNEYHALIVRLAKTHCRKKPLCEQCPFESGCRFARTRTG